ncbi:MAG TPA: hypothetical protein PLC09_11500, partial [Holophaga sp.]|nr:hypothetical protein [Holophaga sp.]
EIYSPAAYADRLARSSHNLIKNGNSEDANPTGFEAAGVDSTPGYARNGSKCRSITTYSAFNDLVLTPKIQCAEGDEFYFEGWARSTNNTHPYSPRLLIRFASATDTTTQWFWDEKSSLGTSWDKLAISGKAPAGTVSVEFRLDSGGTVVDGGLIAWDDFYACRKISAGMLQGDAIQSTTSDFLVTSETASTSTTTGAIVVSGGIGCADYFTGKHRSSDGTAGLTATRTFYAASSREGATNVLNTVTIKDGIITSWTQA